MNFKKFFTQLALHSRPIRIQTYFSELRTDLVCYVLHSKRSTGNEDKYEKEAQEKINLTPEMVLDFRPEIC